MHRTTLYHPPLRMPLLKGAKQHFGLLLHDRTSETKVHYEVECRLATDGENGHLQLHYHRKPVFINGALPEGKIYSLAQQLAAPFYPVVLAQAGAGSPLELVNHEALMARCRLAEAGITQYYEGAVVRDCLRAFEIAYSNPSNVLRVFETDLFLQLVFGILPYAQQPGGVMVSLSLLSQHSFHLFAGEARIDAVSGSKYIDFSGTTPDGKSELTLSYCLHPTGSILKSVTGSLSYFNEQGQTEETTLELYHLNGEYVPQQYRELPAETAVPAVQKADFILEKKVPEAERGNGGWRPLF